MIKPNVGVADWTLATTVGVLEGRIGVGGAVINARVGGMHSAVVTVVEIQAYPPAPPGNSIYHQVLSKLLPATVAAAP